MRVPVAQQRTRAPNQTQQYSSLRADPAAFGAGLGQAIAGLGAALTAREQKTDQFNTLRNLSEYETHLATQLTDMRRNYQPDGKGWTATVRNYLGQMESEFLAATPPQLQEEMRYRLGELNKAHELRAVQTQYEMGDNHFRQGIKDIYEKARTALDPRLGGDAGQLEVQRQRVQEAIDASDLSETEKVELRRELAIGLESVGYRAAVVAGGSPSANISAPIGGIIDAAAARHGVSADALKTIAWLESSGNPRAKNSDSSAGGLFQFIDKTAKQYGLTDRYDPVQAADAGARFLADNQRYLTRVLGRPPTKGELYLAHQQGPGGAAKLLRDPDAPAASIVGERAVTLNGGKPGMTARQFANLWITKAEGAAPNLEDNPAYSNLPYDDRIALREDAMRDVASAEAARVKQETAAYEGRLNSLQYQVYDGVAGQAEIDVFRRDNPNMPFSDFTKLTSALEKRDEGLEGAAYAHNLLTGQMTADPNSTKDKNALNAYVGAEGLAAVKAGDQQYMNNVLLPAVGIWQDIPTDVSSALVGASRSMDRAAAIRAYDTMMQLQDYSPRAFNQRFSEDVQKDLQYYRDRRAVLPEDELFSGLNPGMDAQTQQLRRELRKQAEQVLQTKVGAIPKIDSLVSDFKGQFGVIFGWGAPTTGFEPTQEAALQAEFQTHFIDAYERYGNEADATRVATERTKRRWGVTSVGAGNLMRYPPEAAGYTAVNGSYEWINQEVRKALDLGDGDTFQLVSDETTGQEFEQWKNPPTVNHGPYTTTEKVDLPSYKIVVKRADGVLEAVSGRFSFEKSAEMEDAERVEFHLRNEETILRDRIIELEREQSTAVMANGELDEEIMAEIISTMEQLSVVRADQEARFGAPVRALEEEQRRLVREMSANPLGAWLKPAAEVEELDRRLKWLNEEITRRKAGLAAREYE